MTDRERRFMQAAIELARKGMNANTGGPFGCIIVKGDEIIGQGCNSVASTNDPTAHAEVVAIRDACNRLGTFQLTGCELYTSCEPCPMCLGAIYWARPQKVFYAGTRYDAAHAGFDDSFIYNELSLPFDQRAIPMVGIEREKAIALFEEWILKPDKVAY
jgi:guanine deaminase